MEDEPGALLADVNSIERIADKALMLSSGNVLADGTLDDVERYVPNIRERVDHVEVATPKTFQHYTKHLQGSSFGTKFEGLAVSRALPEQIHGLFHAGSVGIIMSGWLGAINYGVIVANDVDSLLMKNQKGSKACLQTAPTP